VRRRTAARKALEGALAASMVVAGAGFALHLRWGGALDTACLPVTCVCTFVLLLAGPSAPRQAKHARNPSIVTEMAAAAAAKQMGWLSLKVKELVARVDGHDHQIAGQGEQIEAYNAALMAALRQAGVTATDQAAQQRRAHLHSVPPLEPAASGDTGPLPRLR
jgi:hypothetical protein